MTWSEFKGLTKDEQQAFIDEMGKTTPVNGAVLARYFGVSHYIVLRYLHANSLIADAKPCVPIRINENIRVSAASVILANTRTDGTLRPTPELKDLFIQSGTSLYTNDITAYSLRLTHAEELLADKDLCQFDNSNLMRVFDNQFGVGSYTSKKALITIRRYTEFCEALGVCTSKEIREFKPDISQKIRMRMVASPLHLDIRLKKAFAPLTLESIDCLYCCIMWLAFAGVPQGALPTITTDGVDFAKLRVCADDRYYPIYKESLSAFRNACQNTSFVMTNAHGKYTRERVSGNTLLRGFTTQNINVVSMLRYMSNRAAKNGVNLSYALIKQSGHFYRIYELERAGFEPDFAGIIAERIERGTKVANISLVKRDYEVWKKAFN